MTHVRGFALLAVLWTLAAVSGALAVGMATLRTEQQVTRNRLRLARGRWAAEACFAIASGRYSHHRLSDTGTVDLGRSTTCAWRLGDPTARLNLNFTDQSVLQRLFENAGLPRDSANALVQAIVARRRAAPFRAAEDIAAIPGFPTPLQSLFTVDGPGLVNGNAAPERVLLALPGMSLEAAGELARRSQEGRPLNSLDGLAAELSPVARSQLLDAYGDLARMLVFEPPQLLLTLDGWVGSRATSPVSSIALVVVPVAARLATIRRRMS